MRAGPDLRANAVDVGGLCHRRQAGARSPCLLGRLVAVPGVAGGRRRQVLRLRGNRARRGLGLAGVLLVEVGFGSIIRVSDGVHRAAVGGGRVVLCVASVVAARCLAGKSPGVRQALRGHRWTSVGVGRRLRPLAAAVGQRGAPASSLTNAPRLPPAGWSGSHATLPAGGGSCVTLTTPKVHLDQRGRSWRSRGESSLPLTNHTRRCLRSRSGRAPAKCGTHGLPLRDSRRGAEKGLSKTRSAVHDAQSLSRPQRWQLLATESAMRRRARSGPSARRRARGTSAVSVNQRRNQQTARGRNVR